MPLVDAKSNACGPATSNRVTFCTETLVPGMEASQTLIAAKSSPVKVMVFNLTFCTLAADSLVNTKVKSSC